MFRASVEMSLFGSYLKTAIRNLARHRIYSAINIIGIAIAELTLPTFNDLDGKDLSLSDGLNVTTLAFLILLGSIAMFLVVLTTVTAQTLKAARANPADSLRDE